MSKKVVLYHAGCHDGFGAAWAAHQKFGDSAEYTAVQYGQDPPNIEAGSEVYIVDFSYPRPILEALNKKMSKLVVLDHHDTARKELEGLDYATFDMDKSGAV